MNKPLVAIVPAESYEPECIQAAVNKLFELLQPQLPDLSGRVLLKPNLLFPKPPEHAATTHPQIVRAVADYLQNSMQPSRIEIGDSPGGYINSIERFWDKTGMQEALVPDYPLVKFETGEMEEREIQAVGKKASIRIAEPAARADAVINLPKLKTHSLTLFTGALKNSYGVIPGLLKANLHTVFQHPFDFAEFIAAINMAFKPALHIMDAIIGMEGEGPSGGSPRRLGYLIASTDPVALDSTAAALIGLQAEHIPTIRAAHNAGVGEMDLDKIAFPGEDPRKLEAVPFVRPQTDQYTRIPRWLYRILYSFFKTRPCMNDDCVACMRCAKMCPADAISKKGDKVIVDYKACISCFCCAEICEYKAVDLKASWLARKILP